MKRAALLMASMLFSISFAVVAADTQIQGISVVSTSAALGEGNVIHMGGNPITLSGKAIEIGGQFPNVELDGLDGKPVKLGAKDGEVKLISVVPNLMTKVCEVQTHDLSEQSQAIEGKVKMITVSMDSTSTQNKFSQEAKINNLQFLSDRTQKQFGNNTGLLISTPRFEILARAIVVVDGDNVVRYIQVMDELTTMPDMQKAREVAASLI